MEISLALLADAANVSQQGKLNILGVFDQLRCSQFPCSHPTMVLVLQLHAGPAEYDEQKEIIIRLVDEDGRRLLEVKASLTVRRPAHAGARATLPAMIHINGARFPRPGAYLFAVLVGGETKREVPLLLTEAPPPRPAQASGDSTP